MRTRILLTWLLALGALGACSDDATTPQTVEDTAELPADQVIYQTRHVMTREGVRSAVLEGDTAYLREGDGWLDMVGVRLQFFGADGRESGTLTSETGEYNIREGSFVARGDAKLVTYGANGERRVLDTEELHYDQAGDQLWTDVPFVLTQGDCITRGRTLRSDSRFETWNVSGATTENCSGGAGADVSF